MNRIHRRSAGFQPLASGLNAHLVTSAGVVVILIAVARATMAIVVSSRLTRAIEGLRTEQAVDAQQV